MNIDVRKIAVCGEEAQQHAGDPPLSRPNA
jgi:hypothetical protein